MADDMANGTEDGRHYVSVTEAQLGERVTNLGRRQNDLETEMRTGFRAMEQSITAFTNETRTSFAAITQTMAERNRQQWQALGVAGSPLCHRQLRTSGRELANTGSSTGFILRSLGAFFTVLL